MSFPHSLDGAVVSFLNYSSGTAIDLALQGGDEEGAPIVGYRFHGRKNQQWRLVRMPDSSDVWPTYMIRNVLFERTCIDLGGKADGTKIRGSAGNSRLNSSQIFRLITADTKGRVFLIQNIATNTFLDLASGSAEPGTPIWGWTGSPDFNNKNQLWRIVRMEK